MLLSHLSKEIDRVQNLMKEYDLVVRRSKQAIKSYNPSHDCIDELVDAYNEIKKVGRKEK